jgi:hypothetical protein
MALEANKNRPGREIACWPFARGNGVGGLMAKPVGMACFVAAALFSGCCSAQTMANPSTQPPVQTIVGPSGKPLQPGAPLQLAYRAKCSHSPTGCYEQATSDCRGGSYQILDSESHTGGLFLDLRPGPFTWYTMSYTCGPSDGRLATFPFRDDRPIPPPPVITTCTNYGFTISCTSH